VAAIAQPHRGGIAVQSESWSCAAPSFDRALDRLAEEASALGFDAVDYAFMPRARTPDGGFSAPDIESRNLPPNWKPGWSRYCREDPYLWTCYRRNLPLDWDEVKGAAWLSDTQKQAIAYIDGLGFLDGITVPIHLAGGSFAFVSGMARPRHGVWRAQQASTTEKLFVLAHTFHAAVARHVGGARGEHPVALAPRECDVLHHAARGLSAPETARLMHRSVETVRRQRKSAMDKLGAHTIAHAVARAVSLSLIEPHLH
jgi:LuxR family transcriptional regulator